MKGIYSGRQILALKAKGMKITRTQTAAQAETAIIRKYGSISPEGKYFHVGKGNWNKYSLKSDQTRTGRLAPDLKTWREAPHKWDMRGIDTKKEDSWKKNKSQPKLRKDTIISTPKQKVVTELKRGSYEPVETKITKKPTKPKSEIKANHVYGSFMRPLWIGFNPGVAYREIKVTDSHKDFRFNRKPHSVIVTSQPITQEKIKALELMDLIKGKKLAREVKRIKGLNFLDDNMKESLISQVLAGKDKAVIDKYIEKGRQLAEKKQKKQKFSVSKLKQSGKLAGRQSKTQPRLKNITPKTKVIITKAPKITIDQHFTKGKRSGSFAPTRIVNTPLEAFKIYMKHKDKYDTGLMFEAGAGTLTTANEITQAAKVDTPSVIYNAIVKKLNLDKYYAYLKYTDDPMKLKTSPLRTLALRENWNRGAVL